MKMYFNNLLLCLLLFVSNADASSGGSGHVPSIFDLKWPAINFLILLIVAVTKLRKPISVAFDSNSKKVRDLFNLAQEKDKEAQLKHDVYRRKLEDVQKEEVAILNTAEADARKFAQKMSKETESQIELLKKDISSKLDSEKSRLLQMIKEELVDEVINKAKHNIGNSSDLKKKAAKKLLLDLNR